MRRQTQCNYSRVVEVANLMRVEVQIQLPCKDIFDTENVQRALLYELHPLAGKIMQASLLGRINVTFWQ